MWLESCASVRMLVADHAWRRPCLGLRKRRVLVRRARSECGSQTVYLVRELSVFCSNTLRKGDTRRLFCRRTFLVFRFVRVADGQPQQAETKLGGLPSLQPRAEAEPHSSIFTRHRLERQTTTKRSLLQLQSKGCLNDLRWSESTTPLLGNDVW